jgi:hypothetical protein
MTAGKIGKVGRDLRETQRNDALESRMRGIAVVFPIRGLKSPWAWQGRQRFGKSERLGRHGSPPALSIGIRPVKKAMPDGPQNR